jgi:type II secretory pathway pseudopilin PulG
MANDRRRGRDGRDGQAGFSLLEVVIAAVILFMIIGIAARTLSSGQALLGTVSSEASGSVTAQRILTQVSDRIRNGIIADIEDGASNPLADGATCTNGLRIRLIKSFKGGIERGKTVWIEVSNDGEANVADEVDNDKDGVWDERQIRVKEFPDDDDAVGAVATDLGQLGNRLGTIDRTDPRDPKMRVLSPLTVTRTGNSLRLTVGVLRRDPVMLDKNQKPVLRCFTATGTVTFRN